MNNDWLLDAAHQILDRDAKNDPLVIALTELLTAADDEWFTRFCRVAGVDNPDDFRAHLREVVKRHRH